MTNLSISDELYREAQRAAAAQGQSVDEFVGEAVRKALVESARIELRDGVPVVHVPPRTPPIDPKVVRSTLEEEGW